MIFRWSGSEVSEVSQVFVFEKRPPENHDPPENHENTTFRAVLETKGPRDPPSMQERQILFRIALTRGLYDQMVPQLCPFYVPGSGPPGGLSRKIWIWRPQREDLDLAASSYVGNDNNKNQRFLWQVAGAAGICFFCIILP